jgi:hypothetical protein
MHRASDHAEYRLGASFESGLNSYGVIDEEGLLMFEIIAVSSTVAVTRFLGLSSV